MIDNSIVAVRSGVVFARVLHDLHRSCGSAVLAGSGRWKHSAFVKLCGLRVVAWAGKLIQVELHYVFEKIFHLVFVLQLLLINYTLVLQI